MTPAGTGIPATFNDRTWLLEQQAIARQQEQVIAMQDHYAQMGAGLAQFCQQFHDGLIHDPAQRFSREEMLQLLLAAIEMR